MYKLKFIFSLMLGLFFVNELSAKEIIGFVGKTHEAAKTGSSDCQAATAQTELNINNVRTRLLTGGDLWWDLANGKYEVPKVEPGSGEVSKNCMFAGALWIGGFDALGQLKVAAQTYRQSGNDFYPGPLDAAGEVCQEICSNFDQFWKVTGTEISSFLTAYEENNGVIAESAVPESLLKWPGRNNPFFTTYHDFELPIDKYLAPFWDNNEDNEYNPLDGDYPVLDPGEDGEGIFADQMIWWVFNDKGNSHSETGGEAIGLELRSLAFAYATNDDVNNMTFYKYVVENNSSTDLDSVYFAQWADPDLGNFQDDYVGCDTTNSMGIVYNGDAFDDGLTGYGEEIPMLGVDFFQGPKDENGNQLGMSSFLFYNNDFTVTGNPSSASHYYGYISGTWKDGSPFTFGGNGYGGSEPAPYMFPDDPSTQTEGAWSECAEGIPPADRRFIQSSGPFKLQPGVVNEVIIGLVWVPNIGGCGAATFAPLINADRKAQALFDSNFKIKDGPDAPNMTIRELDKELIISLWNSETSNNANEGYAESDAVLASIGKPDSLYRFQGYRIFQLKNSTISPADYDDPDLAREIFTVDIEDGVATILNFEENPELGSVVPYIAVEGQDNGIKHTFFVTEDQFAPGDKKLVNHKRYYFSALAYSYNNYTPYNPNNPLEDPNSQQIPYLAGRNNVNVYTAIPHNTSAQNGGTIVQSAYGDGPEITQVSGTGNGGLTLELTEESINTILEDGVIDEPVYKGGNGPVDIKIYDPTLIKAAEYRLTVNNNEYSRLPETTDKGGTLERQSDGSIKYTAPDDLDSDYDHFNYEIVNQFGQVDRGSVVLEVNNPSLVSAQAFDDTEVIYIEDFYEMPNFEELNIEIDVLDNDNLAGSTNSEIISVESPTPNGVVITIDTINATITYNGQAMQGFFGKDIFSYTAKVGNKEITANVYVNIIDPNISNEINAVDDFVAISSGDTFTILGNDTNSGTADKDRVSPGATWILEDLTNGVSYQSQTNIAKPFEQAIGGWELDFASDDEQTARPLGFTVSIAQTAGPKDINALISDDFSFSTNWLTTMSDADGNSSFNWIRSGDVPRSGLDDAIQMMFDNRDGLSGDFYDPDENYEGMLEGGIAPYCLTAYDPSLFEVSASDGFYILGMSPACSNCYGINKSPTNTLDNLHSVDVILTADKSLWTRCVVIEMGREADLNEGGAPKNTIRRRNSIDKDGKEINDDLGRSWFPGYAVNLETGERMNMMFSENSYFASEDSKDMVWNPTSREFVEGLNDFEFTNYRMGGEQFVYVMDSRYDEGEEYQRLLSANVGEEITFGGTTETYDNFDDVFKGPIKYVYDQAMYVATTRLQEGARFLSMEEGLVPAAAKVSIRMKRPYEETSTDEPLIYEFDMGPYAATTGVDSVAISALDAIRVVPNPYYAFSSYENSKLDNRVKITNLPSRAIVRIFTLDGTLIRKLELDNQDTDTSLSSKFNDSDLGTTENALEWDLKNHKNIPIASGMYIIHIEAPELGEERTLKWFGVVRPVDLDTF